MFSVLPVSRLLNVYKVYSYAQMGGVQTKPVIKTECHSWVGRPKYISELVLTFFEFIQNLFLTSKILPHCWHLKFL